MLSTRKVQELVIQSRPRHSQGVVVIEAGRGVCKLKVVKSHDVGLVDATAEHFGKVALDSTELCGGEER